MTQAIDPYRRARRWVFVLSMGLLVVLLALAVLKGWPLLVRTATRIW